MAWVLYLGTLADGVSQSEVHDLTKSWTDECTSMQSSLQGIAPSDEPPSIQNARQAALQLLRTYDARFQDLKQLLHSLYRMLGAATSAIGEEDIGKIGRQQQQQHAQKTCGSIISR